VIVVLSICLFLIGIIIASFIEYSVHKYLFHGLGKKRESVFAFHLRQHHIIARKNNFVDKKLSVHEFLGIPALIILFLPIYFLSTPLFYGMTLYAIAFVVLHNLQHKYPKITKKYFWWHWNHHMKNQNKSWNVVLPIADILTGTLEKP
tara:strand:- start:104 stop:547 length:444 start_codon:yes stop_codon:yes gene_type:complete